MLVILIGKSGCGKDSIVKELSCRNVYTNLVSTTSRPMREGEKEGVEYFFVSKEEFLKRVENKELLEFREYHTLVNNQPDIWYYGLGKQKTKADIVKHDYICILETEGAKACMDYYGKENCIVVYIQVSDIERELRARKRGSFDKTEWDRRLEDDNRKADEMSIISDITIENNDLKQCCELLMFKCAKLKDLKNNNKQIGA